MAWPGKSSAEAVANVAGLGLWAASQLLLMVTLAKVVSLELVGVFSLGLAVFSLLMIALGCNLRLAIAVDREDRIALLPAAAIRLSTALAVFAVSLVAMKIYAHDGATFTLAACLIGARIADQLVDIFYGFHQKDGRNVRISLSFAARGLLTILLCIALYFSVANAARTIMAGSLLYFVLSLLIEAGWRMPGRTASADRGTIADVLRNENVRSFSMFPMFDTLHFSSFRLALAPVLDVRTFGLFALALNAFSAAQVLISALGLTSLSRLKGGAHNRAADPFRSALREAALFGTACLVFFAICSAGFALAAVLGMAGGGDLMSFLAGNFAALFLLPFTGFLAQLAIFYGSRAAYWQAPLIGSLTFVLMAALAGLSGQLLHLPPMMLYFLFCAAFLLSAVIRIAVSLHYFGGFRPATS